MSVPAEMCDEDGRMRLALRLVLMNRCNAGQYFVGTRISLPLIGLSSLRMMRCLGPPSGGSLEGNSLEKTSEYCLMNVELSSLYRASSMAMAQQASLTV